MCDKYLAELIDYSRDIEPYSFVQIFAGVGSGKNTFIENLIRGDYTVRAADGTTKKGKPLTVLLITSRRAKVNETLSENDLNIGGNIREWDDRYLLDSIDDPDMFCDTAYGYSKRMEIGDVLRYINEALHVPMQQSKFFYKNTILRVT